MPGKIKYIWVIFMLSICYAVSTKGQSITAAEYFINTDPGVGSGTPIAITGNSTVDAGFSIPVATLAPGFYQLYVRVKDDNNQWSIADQRSFYVDGSLQSSLAPLTTAEYFIDSDPGTGKATPLTIQQGDSVNTVFTINTSGLSTGFHRLFIRVKDQNNQWSIVEQKVFYIDAALSQGPIVAAEYYIDTDAGAGNNTPVSILPGNPVDTGFSYTGTDLPLGKHTINLRVKDSAGNWSLVSSRTFTVCTTYGPIAAFDFAVSDTSVSFINGSQYAASYHWAFGDGDTSNLPNPLHGFKPGVYNTCLISRNDCVPGGDTLCRTVTVKGISAISTNEGGNTGQVTISIIGGGYVPGTHFYLQGSGQSLYGDTLIIQNQGLMTAVLDLAGQPAGVYDAIVVYPDGTSDTLRNGFTVKAGTIPDLWVNMTGDWALRAGFNQVYTITYGNRGSTDALIVPVLISGLPLGTDIEVMRPLFRLDAVPGFEELTPIEDTMRRTVDDSAANESFRLFYLRDIPAGSSGTLQVIFHIPGTIRAHLPIAIQVVLGQPLSDTTVHILPESLYPGSPGQVQAPAGTTLAPLGESGESKSLDWDAIMECTDDLISVAADWAGIKETQKCLTTSWDYLKNALGFFKKEEPGGKPVYDKIFDWTDLSLGLADYALNCSQLVPVARWAKKAVELGKELVESTKRGMGAIDAGRHCGNAVAKTIKYVIGAIAGDPNSKYGIGDSSENHYTKIKPLSYTINFENEPTASANAQTVVVTDTLNPDWFDYSSFGFNAVSIGDSIYAFDNPVRAVLHDFDFSQQYGVKVRVTATFDSTTGIAKWNFFSIDPVTNQQTTNALVGFLPPDANAPQGDGYVAYTVNPAPGTKNGDRICNKASIVFDTNPAIATNCWTNVFDTIKPTSKIFALPAKETTDTFAVSWSGADNLSGIATYDIYVSVNDSAFSPWLSTASTTAQYPGSNHKKYAFYSIATDNAGNIESLKTAAEATTTVDSSTTPVSNKQVLVYPVPAKNILNIAIHSGGSDKATLSLFDVNGQLIRQMSSSLQNGSNLVVLDVSNIASGAYFMKIQRTGTVDVAKVIIVR